MRGFGISAVLRFRLPAMLSSVVLLALSSARGGEPGFEAGDLAVIIEKTNLIASDRVVELVALDRVSVRSNNGDLVECTFDPLSRDSGSLTKRDNDFGDPPDHRREVTGYVKRSHLAKVVDLNAEGARSYIHEGTGARLPVYRPQAGLASGYVYDYAAEGRDVVAVYEYILSIKGYGYGFEKITMSLNIIIEINEVVMSHDGTKQSSTDRQKGGQHEPAGPLMERLDTVMKDARAEAIRRGNAKTKAAVAGEVRTRRGSLYGKSLAYDWMSSPSMSRTAHNQYAHTRVNAYVCKAFVIVFRSTYPQTGYESCRKECQEVIDAFERLLLSDCE